MFIRRTTRFLKSYFREYCTDYTNPVNELRQTVQIASVSLSRQLRSRIVVNGPLTVADYMREVLTNPLSGYYMHNNVLGNEGDFITSPEMGQLFGEMVAIWCISEWAKIGSPKPFQLIELGPGKGTLSQDILKVFNHFKLDKDLSLHLVEISPHLSRLQFENLCSDNSEQVIDSESNHYKAGYTKTGIPVYWYQRLQEVPKQFSIIVAHEFFDALPIHKLQKTDKDWNEILVDCDPKTEKFRYVLSPTSTPAKVYIKNNETRKHIEICPDALVIMEHMASRLEEDGGFALIADYGHDGDKEDTFRSFKKHQLHDPLLDPGTADLTADVDFSQLRSVATKNDKLIAFGPVPQGDFLRAMGIELRLNMLLEKANKEEKEILTYGYNMMLDKDKMGERFKIFSLFPFVLKDLLNKFPVTGFNVK